MTDKPTNVDGDKGFAGFADLVSDVSKEIESATRIEPKAPTKQGKQPESETIQTGSSQHLSTQTETPLAHSSSSMPIKTGSSSGAKWFWAIAIGALILISIGNLGKKESQPNIYPSTYDRAPVTISPDPVPTPSLTHPAISQNEDKPPIGNGLVLNQEQIRYCLSQKIRIDAIEKIINAPEKSEVNSFNALISDYNSRCSDFKYSQGMLESVRANVEIEQATIEDAAQHSWVRKTLGLKGQNKIATNPKSKIIDPRNGQYPIQTQEINSSPTSPTVVSVPLPETKATSSSKIFRMPANAVQNDYAPDGWTCKSNYKQVGNECRYVELPANAVHNDYAPDGWTCNSNYKQVGNGCRYVELPANAVHNDYAPDGWTCKSNFKQVGNECRYVELPANAVHNDYAPDGWMCKSGYRQNGSECWPVVPSNN